MRSRDLSARADAFTRTRRSIARAVRFFPHGLAEISPLLKIGRVVLRARSLSRINVAIVGKRE